jgi:hypothetical protein
MSGFRTSRELATFVDVDLCESTEEQLCRCNLGGEVQHQMAQRRIVIDFDLPSDERQVSEQSLVSRVRAFGEDLFREFSRNEQAVLTLGEVDSAINQLSLTLSSNKHEGSVKRFINKQLVRHNLAGIAHISKVEPDP